MGASDGWQYRYVNRNGSLSDWIDERVMLLQAQPWVLDTFHAMYELRHGANTPLYARRWVPAPSQRRTAEQALQLYPRGTQVARADQQPGCPLEYVWGTISGYLHPYWRARYDDGEWEEYTHTEVKAAIAAAKRLRTRASDAGDLSAKPKVSLATPPRLPDALEHHTLATAFAFTTIAWAGPKASSCLTTGAAEVALL